MVFGYGVHHCVGAAFSRLKMEIAFQQLTTRLPSLRLVPDQQVSYRKSLVGRGISQMLVEWDER
jgi:cytochrome P450